MLTVSNITKKYGDFTALEDFSVNFDSGVYGLLAPNGAGKTTLIKLLTTLLFPTQGQITWDGSDIVTLGERYRELVGYLPQDFGYYPNYSPRQFLRYIAVLQHIPKGDADKRIGELLEKVGLSDNADKKMKKFSGGMKQRVGIAQAMLNDPKILILDEPTAGLDPKERVRLRNLLHSFSKDRIVILSTHIVSDVETIAEQIILIKDHRLYCCDSPMNICRKFSGKVFEVPTGSKDIDQYLFLSERQTESGTVYRVFSETPPESSTPVSPNLEDAFLTIYREDENENNQI